MTLTASRPVRSATTTARGPGDGVVVIGSGFGGLTATTAPNHAPVEVIMICRTAYHLFPPLLYQLATGILSEGEIAPPVRDILRRQRHVEVLLGRSPRSTWPPGR